MNRVNRCLVFPTSVLLAAVARPATQATYIEGFLDGVDFAVVGERARNRRGDRERRRRPQRRDRRRTDRLFRPRDGEDVGLALDVIADILTESRFDAEELEREKNVIVQEIGAVEDTPDDLVFDLFTAAAWPEQPIGRPILGTREGVNGFDRDAIDALFAPPLRAGATIVAAAGAVEHDEIVAPRRGAARAPRAPRAPSRRARRAIAAARSLVKEKLEQTHVVVGFEGRAIRRADHVAAQSSPPRRRRHVVAAVPGGAREARPRLFDLRLSLGLFRHRPLRLLRRRGGQGRRRTDGGRARLPRRGRREPRRGRGPARQGADEGLDLDRARIAGRARPAARAPDASSTAARSRSKK